MLSPLRQTLSPEYRPTMTSNAKPHIYRNIDQLNLDSDQGKRVTGKTRSGRLFGFNHGPREGVSAHVRFGSEADVSPKWS